MLSIAQLRIQVILKARACLPGCSDQGRSLSWRCLKSQELLFNSSYFKLLVSGHENDQGKGRERVSYKE